MNKELTVVSVSRVAKWFKCPKAYALHYNHHLEVEGDTTRRDVGSLFHEGMAAHLRGEPIGDAVDRKAAAELYAPSAVAEAFELLGSYIPMIAGRLGEVYQVENMLQATLPNGIAYRGAIDAIVDLDGYPTIIDWKTKGRFMSEELLALDYQLYLYAFLAEQNGTGFNARIAQVEFRTPGPGPFSLTQKGEYSGTMRATTEARALQAEEFYKFEIPKSLRTKKVKEDGHFMRITYVEPKRVAMMVKRFASAAAQMLKDEVCAPVHSLAACQYCDYKAVCLDES